MKTSQRLIHVYALSALLFAFSATVQAQFNYITNNGTITITGYTGPSGPLDIPDTINGLPVTGIGSQAFYDSGVTCVTIPYGVTNIGTSAFSQSCLTSVTIPESITSIGDSVFWGDVSLTAVTIPGSVTSIGPFAFGNCGLTSLTIPNSVTNLGVYAFSDNPLTDITFPTNITEIPEGGFSECSNLTSVAIPSNITMIGDSAFASCFSLVNVQIPGTVTSIGQYTFSSDPFLNNVTIPASVVSIGDFAFANCSYLFSMYVLGNVPAANSTVFSESPNLTIYYPPDASGWSTAFPGTKADSTANAYTLTVSASPNTGGTVSGGGLFAPNYSETVTATANLGYTFVNWTQNGVVMSSSPGYTFTLSSNVNLVANFMDIVYTTFDDPDGVNGTYPVGIDGTNIVGSYVDGSNKSHGFLYYDGIFNTLDDPNAVYGTFATGISGTNIVGYYRDGSANYHGFLYSDGLYTTLDDPGGVGSTIAQGISGENIVGYYWVLDYPSYIYDGFLDNGGDYGNVVEPNAGYEGENTGTWPQGIDGANIVGFYYDGSGEPHGFLYNGNAYTTLDDPNAVGDTYVQGISGENIVGWYNTGRGDDAFLYNGTNYITLLEPNALNGYASAFGVSGNNIVGSYGTNGFVATVGAVQNYTLNVIASPDGAGSVSGGGVFSTGDSSSQTVTAQANCGYAFANWTVNGVVVSSTYSYNPVTGSLYSFVPTYTFTLTSNMDIVANFTNACALALSVSPVAGGSATGWGTFPDGSVQTVTAWTNDGYLFANWTENGAVVSSSSGYSFTLSSNVSLVANFLPASGKDTIALSVSPAGAGTVAGAGSFTRGNSQTVTAKANAGYAFANWTENGNVVSSSASYTFTLNGDVSLQANFADTAKPSISITNVKTGMLWSNAAFTVMGRATDNVAVASISYSLNSAPYTGNSLTGTSWNVPVTLVPGTNTFSAYAMDTSGNISATDTVKIVYILSAPLTVQTNGMGSITPNDNGALLQIGKIYSLTAKATDGFVFTNWTGSTNGTFTVLTNKATVEFTMQSNLVLVANLVDAAKPFISITNVKTGMLWSNAAFTVMGRATDNVAVASINYSLNNAAYTGDSLTGTSWNVPVTLVPGTNTFSVYATDTSGNISATDTVKVVYILSATLTVQTNGMGSITPIDNGALLQIGKTYALTAKATDGFVFTNWTGSTNGTFTVLTNKATVEFTMQSNLVLVANLVDAGKPFISITNVKTGMLWSNAAFTVMGRATDNVAVASISYSLNSAPYTGNSLAGTSWNVPVTLVPGTNTFSVYATDTSGNISATNTVTIIYVYRGLFAWSERVASAAVIHGGELEVGLALDNSDNCYVTGWFDDTNNFGGVTLTNHSIGTNGSDIFVAKYNSTGSLQWVQQAGNVVNNYNTGNGIGVDTNGNVYVTGRTWGSASFGGANLPASGLEEFYLAKYNNAGALQWVENSFGISDDLYGTGLAVDGAGNSYALAFDDDFDSLYLVKFDTTGALQWVQAFNTSQEVWGTKLALDSAGNVYVRGIFESDMMIGTSNFVVNPAGIKENGFIARFDNSGNLIWVQQLGGANVNEGGVAIDPSGNVYTSGAFKGTLNLGNGVSSTSAAGGNALFGSAFIAEYNSAGVAQWMQQAGGTAGGFYWDLGLDAETNIYSAGFIGSEAAVAEYSPEGAPVWTALVNSAPANPVGSSMAKCAVDPAGHCYVSGWYQGNATFGANVLKPQRTWNYFLAEVAVPSSSGVAPAVVVGGEDASEQMAKTFPTNDVPTAIR